MITTSLIINSSYTGQKKDHNISKLINTSEIVSNLESGGKHNQQHPIPSSSRVVVDGSPQLLHPITKWR